MSENFILHGDCRTLGDSIERSIDCIVTDPPYGMAFQSNNTRLADSKKYSRTIEGDGDLDAAILLFRQAMKPLLSKMADEAEMYVFTAWHVLDVWMPLVRRIPDFELKQMLVWDKGFPGLGDLDGNWGCGHEIILYLKKGRRKLPYRRSGIISIDKLASGQNIHPTEKPVPLIEKLIEMSTDPGDLVVDPFSGSGSTSVAAQNLGRDSIAFELDEEYFNRSTERLKQLGLFGAM